MQTKPSHLKQDIVIHMNRALFSSEDTFALYDAQRIILFKASKLLQKNNNFLGELLIYLSK